MADNTSVKDASDATVLIATSEAGGVHTQHTIVSSGNVTVSGTVTASGPLTDDELRATDVPVTLDGESLTVTATDLDIRNLTSTDVVTVVTGAAAADLGKAEDAAHTSGDVGVMALAVRTDTAATLAGTTGDYAPLSLDALGNLRVAMTDTTGADLDFRKENENWNAADHGILMFGRDQTATPNKYRAINLSAEGDLECNLSDINGNEPDLGAGNVGTGTLRVTLASNQASVPVAATLGAETTKVIGTVNVSAGQAIGATLAAETTKVIGTVNVASGQSIGVTSGTAANLKAEVTVAASQTIAATQGTAANLNCTEASASAIKTSVELIDDAVVADDAGFTPATTKVVMAGFTLDDTTTDVVNEGDAGAARMTADRKQIVVLGESGANYVKGGGSKTDTTAQAIMAASGDAAISNYLCWFTAYNSSSTNTWVEIRDGTSTVVALLPLPAYGGAVFTPSHPIKGSANTAFNAYSGASVTTAYYYGGGYKGV